MTKFSNKRIRYVESYKEICDILSAAKKAKIVYGEWTIGGPSLKWHSFIDDRLVEFRVTTDRYEGKPLTYIFRKDGMFIPKYTGLEAYRIMQRYYKVPSFINVNNFNELLAYSEKEKKFGLSASPIVGINAKYDGKEVYSYVYDLNSAYAAVLMGKIPDTSKYYLKTKIKKNQVGFYFDDHLTLATKEGLFADIVFDLIDSPYKAFAKRWYDRKKNPKNVQEKNKAKSVLVNSVGYLQRINPFMRAYIVNSCNKLISSLIDDDTIMWNTDAIYSAKPRSLNIGNNIGEWKLEKEGLIRYKGVNYQIVENNETHYRGIPKVWFNGDFNILKSNIPTLEEGNLYFFDKEKCKLYKKEK